MIDRTTLEKYLRSEGIKNKILSVEESKSDLIVEYDTKPRRYSIIPVAVLENWILKNL